MQGKIQDWLRALYAGMRYIVTNNGEESSALESTIGILIGDTISPLLFLIYLADFHLPPHQDDLDLNGTVISHLEHADSQQDDLLLISLSPEGLQSKMNAFLHWCRVNFMIINAMKSGVCIHRPRPQTMPTFHFGADVVDVTFSYTYLGVRFQSDARNMFGDHYKTRASKSSAAVHAVLHIDAMVDELPPSVGKTLMPGACIDPLLTYGCEIMPDIDDSLLEKLSDVQSMFLRRSLGVYNRSALTLYTETGIFPLRYRRIDMLLRFLQYTLSRPPETLVYHALKECISLTARGLQGWLMDIQLVILMLRGTFSLPPIDKMSAESVETCRLQVLSHMRADLQTQIDTNKKLYLLWHRTGPVLALRPYLLIENGQHHKSLTRLLTSCHALAVERLRWAERYRASGKPTGASGCSESSAEL
ncbi:hypothetical protein AURDEDRAFT_62170 [Auricularia subglabra TFB-10046 SS5]|nr:hypothetical protein AURDEDRAFT_62170 [Auricularia subglabra TFB-10046 SS5]